ncbi:hypothetical protein DFJ74DRAFT_674981 [Hyaloraphidium curvatum]|nr:hypothetical protein DFJ74DRAFT_674981 [Hyaloraphidium curvatum]
MATHFSPEPHATEAAPLPNPSKCPSRSVPVLDGAGAARGAGSGGGRGGQGGDLDDQGHTAGDRGGCAGDRGRVRRAGQGDGRVLGHEAGRHDLDGHHARHHAGLRLVAGRGNGDVVGGRDSDGGGRVRGGGDDGLHGDHRGPDRGLGASGNRRLRDGGGLVRNGRRRAHGGRGLHDRGRHGHVRDLRRIERREEGRVDRGLRAHNSGGRGRTGGGPRDAGRVGRHAGRGSRDRRRRERRGRRDRNARRAALGDVLPLGDERRGGRGGGGQREERDEEEGEAAHRDGGGAGRAGGGHWGGGKR